MNLSECRALSHVMYGVLQQVFGYMSDVRDLRTASAASDPHALNTEARPFAIFPRLLGQISIDSLSLEVEYRKIHSSETQLEHHK